MFFFEKVLVRDMWRSSCANGAVHQSLETLGSFWGRFGGLVKTDGNTDFPALSVYTSMPEWICSGLNLSLP